MSSKEPKLNKFQEMTQHIAKILGDAGFVHPQTLSPDAAERIAVETGCAVLTESSTQPGMIAISHPNGKKYSLDKLIKLNLDKFSSKKMAIETIASILGVSITSSNSEPSQNAIREDEEKTAGITRPKALPPADAIQKVAIETVYHKKRTDTRSTFFKKPSSSGVTTRIIGIEDNGIIEFSQNSILEKITSEKLNTLKIKYNGLCEIICNYVLLEDLLGEKNPLPLKDDVQANWLNTQSGSEQLGIKFRQDTTFVRNYRNKYGDKITPENLRKVEDTHILHVINFITRLSAVIFSKYPSNLFPNGPFAKKPFTHIQLPNGNTQTRVDKAMLSERFEHLEAGFYIKFFAFKKS